MSKIKALIGNRASKQLRPEIRYGFVLDPTLHAAWIEAQEELDDLPKPDPDSGKPQRANGPRVALQRRVDDLAEQVAAVTAAALFRARTADELETLREEWDEAKATVPQRARAIILACFVRWEEDGKPVDDAGSDDLEALLPNLSQGELYGISTPLANLSNFGLDLPKSVRQSLETRASGMNSTPA